MSFQSIWSDVGLSFVCGLSRKVYILILIRKKNASWKWNPVKYDVLFSSHKGGLLILEVAGKWEAEELERKTDLELCSVGNIIKNKILL